MTESSCRDSQTKPTRVTEPTASTTNEQLRARQTCPVANSVLCCTLFELLFIDTVEKKGDPKDLGCYSGSTLNLKNYF